MSARSSLSAATISARAGVPAWSSSSAAAIAARASAMSNCGGSVISQPYARMAGQTSRPPPRRRISIGALERHRAVRHREHGEAGRGEVVPEQELGLDVHRARQVVEHDQLGGVHERARRRQALALATGEAQPARTDQRRLGRRERGDVVVDRRQGERPRQIVRRHRPEADVVADRVGDQLRHLGQERRVRRYEEGGAVGERSPFQRTSPVTSACQARPSRARSIVLLPAPIGPVTTTNDPRSTRKLTSLIPRRWHTGP